MSKQILSADLMRRLNTIRGLRQFADWLENNPAAPIDGHCFDLLVFIHDTDHATGPAQIRHLSTALGLPVEERTYGGHLLITTHFSGLRYQICHVPQITNSANPDPA
ncbi:hypothetical protein EDD29_8640 [Actinocorallia herbida]|uniref:Uncharacterized protein n=1 Tax=Actinocorallia herbida TaxID=58109 RepID=A0A3N1DBL1_9ACTN|nr:hypothetical protein [Actinocorallia herbida]ROO90899.1 hypothetical protein EDD29_8640 [Actinocorallia herbida]